MWTPVQSLPRGEPIRSKRQSPFPSSAGQHHLYKADTNTRWPFALRDAPAGVTATPQTIGVTQGGGARGGPAGFCRETNPPGKKKKKKKKKTTQLQKALFWLGHRCQGTGHLPHRGGPRDGGSPRARSPPSGEETRPPPSRAGPSPGDPRRTEPRRPHPGLGTTTGRPRRRSRGGVSPRRRPSFPSATLSPATALPSPQRPTLSPRPPPAAAPRRGHPGWVPARPSPHRKRAPRRAPAPPPRRGLTGSQLQAAVPPAAPQRPLPALQDVVVLGLEQLHPRTPPPPPGEREGGRASGAQGVGRKGEGRGGARSRAERGRARARAATGSPASPAAAPSARRPGTGTGSGSGLAPFT